MNSKFAAQLAFGDPGFFDFIAPVLNLARNVGPLNTVLNIAERGGLPVTSLIQTAIPSAAPVLEGARLVSGGAFLGSGAAAGAALIAPALAASPLAAALPRISTAIQQLPSVTSNILDTDGDGDDDDRLGDDGDYDG